MPSNTNEHQKNQRSLCNLRIKFKHQQFQADACNAICDVFAGQPNAQRKFSIDNGNAQELVEHIGCANPEISLARAELLKNLQEVQKQHSIIPSQQLEPLKTKRNDNILSVPTFTIEMETGTGKTYTYIKTMYELNQRYGWSKFIVVTPSIAIREGVLKSFQITEEHFAEEYGKKCRFFLYNSSRLTDLEMFSSDAGINAMIINTQAFNARGADAKRIYMKLDSFRSRRPIDVIAAVNPILIIDEPQSVLGTEKDKNVTREAIGNFNPLFCINYSATHRENFNMAYRLDAIDAYQKQLVKKITVKGINIVGTTATNGYLYLQKINVYPGKQPDADIVIECNQKTSASIKKSVKRLKKGDNIYSYSGGLEAYKNGLTISSIDARSGEVEFTNGLKLSVGECVGDASEGDLRRIQIRETIASHIERERELFKKGIKVLSLFFIDEVAKYKYYDDTGEQAGPYAELFEEEYEMAVEHLFETLPFGEDKEYRAYLEKLSREKIHAGYFSVDKKGHAVNSAVKRDETESDDISAYDLIMKNKERLLSFGEPVRFIFSHSALREGWDNPNVFQICTLRTSSSEIKKRQEVGRGLRLSVNHDGERQDSETLGAHGVHDVNTLTVIANGSYENFAKGLQDEFYEVIKNRPKEITEKLFENAVVVDGKGNEKHLDGRDASRIFVRLEDSGVVKDGQLTDAFHLLESKNRIAKIAEVIGEAYSPYTDGIIKLLESVYNGKRQPLVSNARNNAILFLDKEKYSSKQFKELWNRINAKSFYAVAFEEDELVEKCIESLNRNLSVTELTARIKKGSLQATNNAVSMVSETQTEYKVAEVANSNVQYDLLGELALPTGLTRVCIGKILQGIHPQRFSKFRANPEEFIRNAIKLIDEQKASTVIEHITYNKLSEQWNAAEIFIDNSISGEYGKNVADAKKHLYDKLRYDSAVEKKLADEMDISEQIELYVKLPSGFYINTPMGKYNPDWAIVLKEGAVKHIYFVAESKGTVESLQLREVERAKIECARRHFAAISNGEVKYDVVDSFEKLMEKIKN